MSRLNRLQSLTILLSCLAVLVPAVCSGVSLDSRWESRDFYNTLYFRGIDAQMGWTGNYATGNAGSVSAPWRQATLDRVNFFRAMAGVPAPVVFDPALDAMCQQAALMMSANGALSHTPPSNWLWWTQAGYDAAYNGNLGIGSSGAAAIEGYMNDYGSVNYRVGHRRWMLLPQTTVMGNGDVPGDTASGKLSANCLWVIPQTIGARPPTRDGFVAWPPAGHVPAQLVFSRWSFSYPGADFSSATVSMRRDGQPIAVRIEPQGSGIIGEPTIVWVPEGRDTNDSAPFAVPAADQQYAVTIGNVKVGAQTHSFSYTTTVYDPSKPGAGEFAAASTLTGKAVATAPATFAVTSRPFAEGVQGRVLTDTQPYSIVHGAEAGANPFSASISAGYSPIQSTRVAGGSAAFRLATPEYKAQILTLPDEYHLAGSGPALTFQSSLAWATAYQYASVDINTGEGAWISIWSQAGPATSNNGFVPVAIDLSAWQGRTVRLRFRYDVLSAQGSTIYDSTSGSVGWAFDNVALTGANRVAAATLLPARPGASSFSATFETPGTVLVQARDIAFGGHGLDWGPVTAVAVTTMTSVDVPSGAWTDDPVLGWTYGYSDSWKYNLSLGFIYEDAFPWMYTQDGWVYYLRGSVYNGLWLYHVNRGYAYTQHDYGGWYLHGSLNPQNGGDWARFYF